jgi:hypothetical protein
MAKSVTEPLGHHFIKQFNPEQAAGKRNAAEYAKPPPPPPVCQPFNAQKFNFNKARSNEVLIYIREKEGCGIEVCNEGSAEGCHSVFVNVSPCTHGQFLMVPSPKHCFPQQMTELALKLGLWLLADSQRPDLRLIFNSGGAWSSVNHLHLQGCYLKDLHDDGIFPVERLPRTVVTEGPVTISVLGSHALPTYIVGTPGKVDATTMSQIARVAMAAISHMQKNDIAHNMMMTVRAKQLPCALLALLANHLFVCTNFLASVRFSYHLSVSNQMHGGASIFIYPRKKNDSMDHGGMNVAAFECNGQVRATTGSSDIACPFFSTI